MPEMTPVAEFDFVIVGAVARAACSPTRLSANPRTDWCFTTEADPWI
jgi:hypothetical protein